MFFALPCYTFELVVLRERHLFDVIPKSIESQADLTRKKIKFFVNFINETQYGRRGNGTIILM